jgi:hypothetical protein
VVRIAPTCERVGTFFRKGRRGTNETRFSGRIDGRPLPPGTYRIVSRSLGRGRATTAGDKFVVVAPSESVASARAQPSTCAPRGGWSGATWAGGSNSAVLVGAKQAESGKRSSAEKAGSSEGDGDEEEGGVAQFRESSPDAPAVEDEVPAALVLSFAALLLLLVGFLAYVGARDLRGRLRGQ